MRSVIPGVLVAWPRNDAKTGKLNEDLFTEDLADVA
jgi:hypothetical protein